MLSGLTFKYTLKSISILPVLISEVYLEKDTYIRTLTISMVVTSVNAKYTSAISNLLLNTSILILKASFKRYPKKVTYIVSDLISKVGKGKSNQVTFKVTPVMLVVPPPS